MKQQGTTWNDHEGKPTQHKYLPAHIKLNERLGQKIASAAEDLFERLAATKRMMISACEEAFRNNPGAKESKTFFSFYTYDKEFKVEYDLKHKHVRVYRAKKKNPTAKDYFFIPLDFSSINPGQLVEEPAANPPELVAEFEGMAKIQEETVTDQNDAEPRPNEGGEGVYTRSDGFYPSDTKLDQGHLFSQAEPEPVSGAEEGPGGSGELHPGEN